MIWGGMEMDSARKTTVVVLNITQVCSFAKDRLNAKTKPNLLKNIYFGGQHLYTQYSSDASAAGKRNAADNACNFAKGKPVNKSTCGEVVQKKSSL